jgi:heme-degrading monooxygenase HmoA
MPVIVVTRLRLKDRALLDDFFAAAVAALEQAKQADGNLGSDVLADANDAWWTLTAWQDRGPMQGYVAADPHRTTMARLDTWCDEATFADWEQPGADLPSWAESYRRLVADGQVASLTRPSPAHLTRDFPPPVEPAAS